MYKKIFIIFLFLECILYSQELEYDTLDDKLKESINYVYDINKKETIKNIINTSSEYIPINTYGENILTEIDDLKTIYSANTIFDIFGENKKVEIDPKIGMSLKFLEKGNELNFKVLFNYNYKLNDKTDSVGAKIDGNVIFRKTNTMLSFLTNYNYNKKISSHIINGNLKLSNQINIKNKYIFDLGLGYLYNILISSNYEDKRKILWENKKIIEHGINLSTKVGYKLEKEKYLLYFYGGLDFDYIFTTDKKVKFKNYNIFVDKDEEKIYFVPNIGVELNINNKHNIKFNAQYLVSLKQYDRYKIGINYSYFNKISK